MQQYSGDSLRELLWQYSRDRYKRDRGYRKSVNRMNAKKRAQKEAKQRAEKEQNANG